MLRSTFILAFAAIALSACVNPSTPRPFSGRGGRSLDQPPRYGDANRYVQPIAPAATPPPVVDGLNPLTIPPGANTTPPADVPLTPAVDQGLTVSPPGTTPPPAPTVPGTTPPTDAPTPPPTTAPGDVPFARSVPGKPGYVYSPKDSRKIISVDGLRPGSKAKDPETGEIFRVPYQ
jgi:hypothetical protein